MHDLSIWFWLLMFEFPSPDSDPDAPPHLTAHATYDGARQYLAEACRDHWNDNCPDETTAPDDDDKVIEQFFAYQPLRKKRYRCRYHIGWTGLGFDLCEPRPAQPEASTNAREEALTNGNT
jgi:hypothetical protein